MDYYWEAVRSVAIVHQDEIRIDLDRLRLDRNKAQLSLAEVERRIAAFEMLLELVHDESIGDADRRTDREELPLTLHDAMAEVLRDKPDQMLRAGDLAREINGRGLYRMRDGRPVEPQQIHARVGHYKHMFERKGTFIRLRDEWH
ncbi:MAG TPA: hypothetical protein VJA46_13100 [Acidimicrobiia bacterium]|nr:hypothetical protein [Acidimicrobiia bacterium]